jgi:hypothetical protein
MALIDRSDLQYDYTWTSKPGNSPRSDSTSKSSMFRRDEGSDVLALINDYVSEKDIKNKEEALRIERLIREKLSGEKMTREEVRAWIENNHKLT